MSRKIHGENDSEGIISDGTAARTRPLSIKDIMVQREKKVASEAKKAREGLDNDKGKSTHLEQGREHKSRNDLRDMPVGGSRKEKTRDIREGSKKENPRHIPRESPKKEDMRYTPKEASKKDNPKDRLKPDAKMDGLKDAPKVPEKEGLSDAPKKGSKKHRPSVRDDGHSVGKDKVIHHSQKLSTSMSGRVDESKDRNPSEIRERKGDAMKSEYQKGPGKRWNDETVDDDKIKFKSEKLRNETKRRERSFDNEKSAEVDRPMLKRQDSGRFQDSKHSDRNAGRNEYAKPYHGEPRLKRRRSRSRDHDRERHDRSISPPIREQRYNHRGRDFVNYPPYYMEKSRRKYAEGDKQRSSGSGGSHQRYESRLGGYSPRKKKTSLQAEQATTKTPSQVIKSPEKKSATWDQLPVKANQSNFPTTLLPTVGQMGPTPFNFGVLKKDPSATVETVLAGNSLTADSVQLTQATRPLRRLHIENLPDSATEDKLIDFLNDCLLPTGVKPQRSKPCLSCLINKEKRQAFVEFLTPEDATAALSFDGRSLNGSALRIRRPKEYVETVNVTTKKPVEETALISDDVADSPHKIFIAGIAGVISSEMLMEIVSAFGPLAAYRFLFNNELGGPCAFLEYADRSITSKACAGLNGMMLGGCLLTAVHVFPNPPVETANEASPFYGIPDNAKSLLKEPTKVLQLKNVFDREEYMLLPKSELEEILEDVRVECTRFGAVKSINVVEYPACGGITGEDNIVQLEAKPVKIEYTEFADTANIVKAVSECSVPNNQSIDVIDHSDASETKDVDLIPESQDQKDKQFSSNASETKDVDLIPENQDQKDKQFSSNASETKDVDLIPESQGQKDKHFPSNAALCESKAPVADEHADLDETQSRAALPTSQHAEAEHTEAAADVNEHTEVPVITTVMDDGALEKIHEDRRTTETCSPAEPTDSVEKPGTNSEQQGADDATEDRPETVSTVETSDTSFVFEPGSVLVEFMRKEAACIAAHSLHGRRFGNRTVHAGYAPYDLCLQKYPR